MSDTKPTKKPMYRWADAEAWLNGTAVDPVSTPVDTRQEGGA